MRHLVALSLLVSLTLLSAIPALASRAELDGRGLPRLLAVDPSNIRLLPGSAGKLDALGLVDYSPETRTYYVDIYPFDRYIAPVVTNDAFVLGVVGEATRYAYFLDGSTHNVLMAHPSGWGVTVGFGETFSEFERYEFLEFDDSVREQFITGENTRRELRVGFGWQKIEQSGRVLELGIGGTYLDWDLETRIVSVFETQPPVETEGGWKSDPGIGFDATVRSLSQAGGLQIAAHFRYADLNPESELASDLDATQKAASLDVGWRVQTPHTDDLVFGFLSSWSEDLDLSVNSNPTPSTTVEEQERTAIRFGVFLSGERNVIDNLTVRGGIHGTASFSELEQHYRRDDPNSKRETDYSNSSGTIDSPQFFLGAGYRWKGLRTDAQLYDRINLDSPFVRWSVSLKF